MGISVETVAIGHAQEQRESIVEVSEAPDDSMVEEVVKEAS